MRRTSLHARSAVLLPVLALAGGCFDEDLPIYDLEGTLVVPREAATTTINVPVDASGTPITDPNATPDHVEQRVVGPDVRMLGPVYVGLYADVIYDFRNYPHPEVGPPAFDAFPYGGTTVGDFRYACFEYFKCKMVSGRYTSFDDILEFFNDELVEQVTDVRGHPVVSGDVFRATCYELLNITADSEVRITGDDLDFVETPEGDFVADFVIRQADYFDGMTAWAWMDAPKGRTFQFSSCNDQLGYTEDTYDQRWYAGTAQPDVLNHPYAYLQDEDWVASHGEVWSTPWTRPEIRLDFNIGSSDIGPLRTEAAAGEAE